MLVWHDGWTGGLWVRLEERKVAVRDLLIGMYVCRLERDWEDTPFPLQGVMVRSQADIDALAEYSVHVYIDIEMGIAPHDERGGGGQHRRSDDRPEIEKLQNKMSYHDTATFDDELPRAREAQALAVEFASKILDDVREGRPICADDVRSAVEPMVNSILRNMDAFMWIESLRKRDAYDYSHALNCSALAAMLGRHVGFPEDILTDLAIGGLLLDVGKLRIDGVLLAKAGPLSRDEIVQVRRHVEHGLRIMDEGGALPPHVHDMIRSHHERNDGDGYPDRLAGNQIPLFGRIAAIVDAYDAMTSDRSYRKAMGKHAALQELYRMRDKAYAAEIVEQFMQCLSVYPTGSLVELGDGRVALVIAQNPARRLRPRVMVLTGPDKQLESEFHIIDLMHQAEGAEGAGVLIATALEPGAYGLDPTELYL
jgi:HD-GYP domain-containing protein (c-di-GMP phosphodiesterase class II)